MLDLVGKLPRRTECMIIQNQLAKSGTSVGANVEEADGTITKKDFVNKMVIARKEAKETKYWLRLIAGRYLEEEHVNDGIRECEEITKILSAIINKSR